MNDKSYAEWRKALEEGAGAKVANQAQRPGSMDSGRISEIAEGRSADEQSRGLLRSREGISRAGERRARIERAKQQSRVGQAPGREVTPGKGAGRREAGQGDSDGPDRPNTPNVVESSDIKRPRGPAIGSQGEAEGSETNTQLMSFGQAGGAVIVREDD